jgi:hypothetical protein
MEGVQAVSETTDRVIREFYPLLNSGNSDAMTKFVMTNFAETASVTWPESHPRAGVVAGREHLQKLFSRIAAGPPIRGGVNFQLVDVIAREDAAAARITFEWVGQDGEPRPNGALEWWSFNTDGLVSAIVPFYWDGHQVATKG